MSKRPLAALCALLAFMAVLVAVPLATSETAEAHTKTVKRCSYDPFINQSQCWTETVAHTHRVIPDNPPPPVEKCPDGTTGTPPNCSPVPPTNENRDPDPPPTTAPPPPPPPPTTAPPPPPPPPTTAPLCVPPAHRYGNGCHEHSFDPPCGTGLWVPHAGHTPQRRPPCPPPHRETCVMTKGQVVTPDKTLKGLNGEVLATCGTVRCTDHRDGSLIKTLHLHAGQGTCHLADKNHCTDGHHQHEHGTSQCHEYTRDYLRSPVGWDKHRGYSGHCATDGEHQHDHGSGDCHAADTIHCPVGQHGHDDGSYPEHRNHRSYTKCHPTKPADHHCGGDSGSNTGRHKHDGLGCHPAGVDNCPTGQHEHVGDIYLNVYGCHALDTEHPDYFTKGDGYVLNAVGEIVCFFVGGAAGKAVKLVNKGAAWLKRWLGGQFDSGANVGCNTLLDKAIEASEKHSRETKEEHDEDAQDKDEKDGTDDSDGSDDDSGEDSDDDSGDDDSGTDDADADPEPTPDPKPTAAEIKQNDDELNEAARRYRDEEITLAEYQAAFRRWMRWRCEEMGQTKWCNR